MIYNKTCSRSALQYMYVISYTQTYSLISKTSFSISQFETEVILRQYRWQRSFTLVFIPISECKSFSITIGSRSGRSHSLYKLIRRWIQLPHQVTVSVMNLCAKLLNFRCGCLTSANEGMTPTLYPQLYLGSFVWIFEAISSACRKQPISDHS